MKKPTVRPKTKKAATSKKTAVSKKSTPRKASRTPAKQAAMKEYGARADLGAPVTGFFDKQPPPLRALLDELRRLIEKAAPDATSSIKWGMPFFEIGGAIVCALGAHKSHVNLILPGPPGTYADPDGLLTGAGKTGRHLKLSAGDTVPTAHVRGWLKTAVGLARA